MSAGAARHSGRTTATRERLYAAAIGLFGEHGIDQVSVETIAAAAGVAKGTVYYNFGSKEALVSDLLDDHTSTLVAMIATVSPGSGALDALIDTLLQFVEEQPTFVQLLAGELWRPASRWRTELLNLRERLIGAIEDRIAPDRRDDASSQRTAAGAILVTCLGIGLDWQAYNPSRGRAEIAGQLRALLHP